MQETTKLDLSSAFKQIQQRLFLDAISQFDGTIDLIWDGKKLMRQLNLVITPKLLTDHTNVVKNYSLEVAGQSNSNNALFLLYPTQRSVELVIKNWLQIASDEEGSCSNHIFFIPEETYTLRERLKEDERVWNRISTVSSLPLHWFPTEQCGLITMDLPQLPSQMLINGDWNYLFKCAKSLRYLVSQFSRMPKFYCKGEWSARIADILRKLPEKLEIQSSEAMKNDFQNITNIIIIDRWTDHLTPMLKQFTFAGACDEFFGIDSRGIIKVPFDEFEEIESADEAIQSKGKMKEIQLNDQVFGQLQDLNVNNVAFKLREIVDDLKEEEQQRKTLASLAEYKKFVAKLPNVVVKRKSTGMFMRLAGIIQRRETDEFYRGTLRCEQEILKNAQADRVHPFIENSLIQAKEINVIMRLIILQSLNSRGLKASVLQAYTRLIIQSYGISELKWLLRLQLAGIIRDENIADARLETRYPMLSFVQLLKKHKFSLADIDEMRRSGLNHSGGRPSLLVRIIEEGLMTNLRDFTHVSVENIVDSDEQKAFSPELGVDGQTLVFVVGGITRDEMSMLNHLPRKVICCTTAFLNAEDLLESFRG